MMVMRVTMRAARVATMLAVIGSAGCAYHAPAEPTAAGVSPLAPFQMTLGSSTGSGAATGITVTARVQNVNGAGLANVVVTFAASGGTVAPITVTTGLNGTASSTLVASDTAEVTAVAAGLTAHMIVAPQPPSQTTPTPTPGPSPPPSPTPSPSVVYLNMPSTAVVGDDVTLSVSSTATGVTWNWSFGDGMTRSTTSFTTTHTYTVPGPYVATVSSAQTASASAAITVSAPTPSAAPQAAGLKAIPTCTAGKVNAATTCNVSATYNGQAVPATSIRHVQWNWGDGNLNEGGTGFVAYSHVFQYVGTYTVIVTINVDPQIDPKVTDPVDQTRVFTATTNQTVTITN
jgi:hypothetical protein